MNVVANIQIGIDPNIGSVGPFLVTWHGFFTAAGIAAVVLWAVYQGRRHGIHEDAVYGTAVWAVIGGLSGARLVHVIDNWDYYIQDPLLILRIYEGGIGLLGGILGATVAGSFYAWRHRYPVGRMVDLVTPGLLLGMFIGRFGDIINGEHLGETLVRPWAFLYTHPSSPAFGEGPMHPVIVYEMALDAAIGVIAFLLIGKLRPAGSVFYLYLLMYGLGRFVIQFLRRDMVWVTDLGLQQAHLLSLLLVGLALAFLLLRRVRFAGPEDNDEEPGAAPEGVDDAAGENGEAPQGPADASPRPA